MALKRSKPTLRAELLFNLAFLAAAALLLGVGTSVALAAVSSGLAFPLVLGIVAADVGVFIVFGGYLVTRHVLRPVARLVDAADAETRDFALLAERLNRMTDRLLDAQSQLVRSEKLASVGRLAAGIAHEVGNPLGAIGTYLEVLQRRGGDAEVMAGIRRELDRIDRIVRGLLDYARPQEDSLQPVALAVVARTAFELLRGQGALKNVTADLDLDEGLPTVLGRAHVLEQVLVNLVLNAVDAAPGGRLVVGARRWHYEEGTAPPRRASDGARAAFPRPGERRPPRHEFSAGRLGALLFVADSGPGIAPEDRDQIFEPFYTTKPPGRGTGLGLAIVARAVYDMGGVVWVETAREGGAAFKLFFPEAPR